MRSGVGCHYDTGFRPRYGARQQASRASETALSQIFPADSISGTLDSRRFGKIT